MNKIQRRLSISLSLLLLLSLSCGKAPTVSSATPLKPTPDLCARFDCEGNFLTGITWNDVRGENAFFITEVKEEREGGMRQTLQAYRYVIVNTTPRIVWQGEHSALNQCDLGDGIIGNVTLTDLNEDGVGEVIYLYNVSGNCDVSPKRYGLLMHNGMEVFEIEGSDNLAVNKDLPGNGEMELSQSLKMAPKVFRDAAVNFWKSHVPSEYHVMMRRGGDMRRMRYE